MTGLVQRFRLTNEPGSLGLSCNASGLALAGVPLLRKRGDAFVPRSPFEIELLIQAAYCGTTDAARLLRGLAVVADALSQGNLAKAMIAGTLLKLPELDWNGAVRIANAEDTLSKYDPSQPRDWHRRWTIGDAGDAERSEADSVIDIAYQGKYHDSCCRGCSALAGTGRESTDLGGFGWKEWCHCACRPHCATTFRRTPLACRSENRR